jgi:predicted CXXCH cytochrome family protein
MHENSHDPFSTGACDVCHQTPDQTKEGK